MGLGVEIEVEVAVGVGVEVGVVELVTHVATLGQTVFLPLVLAAM